MSNEIISYMEMCVRENASLQRGMNFRLGGNYSVILMSTRPNAPYKDEITEDGTILIYEGHDISKNPYNINPKETDQPEKKFYGKSDAKREISSSRARLQKGVARCRTCQSL
ncbi:MAG TPA: hypothetical protein VGB00_09770 [Pyrinomonadaceae bacterium]|jgi:predicted RNA-binding protein with PUA domain